MTSNKIVLIGLVGPCASGKSTLTTELEKRGYHVRHIAQEHSYVPDMWRRITNPDILIFLDASYPITCLRSDLTWHESDYNEQKRRLAHAREHADMYLLTDNMSIAEVLERVVTFINQKTSGK